jgi:hypothetical protein
LSTYSGTLHVVAQFLGAVVTAACMAAGTGQVGACITRAHGACVTAPPRSRRAQQAAANAPPGRGVVLVTAATQQLPDALSVACVALWAPLLLQHTTAHA